MYFRRWNCQENAICDWLMPLNLEIVCAQMTKTCLFTVRGGWDHIADLDLVVGDHHAVNEQFDQVPFLFETGLFETSTHTLAKFLHRLGDPSQFHVFVGTGFQLPQLGGEAFQSLFQFWSSPLVFFQGNYARQLRLC